MLLSHKPRVSWLANRERVDFAEIIGEFVKVENGQIISVESTAKGVVHYSNKGMHVVPSDPSAVIK